MSADDPPGVRYEQSLTLADVGCRVMVRRRLPEGGYGDLLGTLESWAEEVVVRDRHGATHTVARADLVAGKRIPPPPERR